MTRPDALGESRRILLVVILGVLSMLAPLGIDMYLPGMPSMARDLGVSPNAAQLTLSGYMLGFAFGQLIHGPLADSLGRRRVLIAGTLAYGLFSLLCGLAASVEALVGLRFLQGVGGAASSIVVFALMRDIYDRKEDLARMMSFVSLVMMAAPLLAPLVGGYLLLWSGWRAVFWLLAAVGLAAVLLAWRAIPETLPREGRPPLRLGGTIRNFRALLGRREVMGHLLAASFPVGGMFAFITAGSFVYIDFYGVSPQRFGYFFGLNVMTMTCFILLNGRLVRRVGVRRMLECGLAINCLAGLWLACVVLLDLGAGGFWPLVGGVMLFVGSIAAIGSNATALAMAGYPHLAGTLASLGGMLRFGAGGLIGALVALLPSHTPASMALTMTGCGIAAVGTYVVMVRARGDGPEEGTTAT
jgi:DHA1 family bicyclomycin/chloramphenicol resistance-like MFS transporter